MGWGLERFERLALKCRFVGFIFCFSLSWIDRLRFFSAFMFGLASGSFLLDFGLFFLFDIYARCFGLWCYFCW